MSQGDCGRTGIRTLERVAPLTVFKTVAFVRSAILPGTGYPPRVCRMGEARLEHLNGFSSWQRGDFSTIGALLDPGVHWRSYEPGEWDSNNRGDVMQVRERYEQCFAGGELEFVDEGSGAGPQCWTRSQSPVIELRARNSVIARATGWGRWMCRRWPTPSIVQSLTCGSEERRKSATST